MSELKKAFGLPESVDPSHVFVFRTGEYGVYDYMYKDNFGNYYKYTNAPKDDPSYDPHAGDAILLEDQPSMAASPEFYDPKTMHRLTLAIPADATDVIQNEAYSPDDPERIWHTMYTSAKGDSRYVYVETDVIENFDLWATHLLRLTDSTLTPYRKYVASLFLSENVKDRIVAAILILADQGMLEPNDLVQLTVGDVEYIDKTIKVLGRKLVPDPELLDFFLSITVGRNKNESLFLIKTAYGERPIGVRHIYSILKFLKVNSHALLSWHVSQAYTRIMARLVANKVPFEDAEVQAFAEIAGMLSSVSDVSTLVSGVVRTTVEDNYAIALSEAHAKEDTNEESEGEVRPPSWATWPTSITYAASDNFGALLVFSGLSSKTPEELEFSRWLHAIPLHDAVVGGKELKLNDAAKTGETEESGEAAGEDEGEDEGAPTEGVAEPNAGAETEEGAAQAPDTQHGAGGGGVNVG